jgi:hypothetical protein
MKSVLFAMMTLLTTAAWAQPIELKAGATVVINGEVVSCQGPSEEEMAPACSIKQDGAYYRLYAGSTIVETFVSFDSAIAGAKKMKDAGLCR